MSKLREELRGIFRDEHDRYAYVEANLNASIAAQIKRFRAGLSQKELAERIGTKQSGISRLENSNYSAWKVDTLRKLARAFGLRLKISFEEFGTLIPDIENFQENILSRRSFADDPIFGDAAERNNTKDADLKTPLRLVPGGADAAQYASLDLDKNPGGGLLKKADINLEDFWGNQRKTPTPFGSAAQRASTAA